MEGGHNFKRVSSKNIPVKLGLIWFSSFREDFNVIFYQNMPNLHNRYKLVKRKISQKKTGIYIKLLIAT
jgi:hypothetical protein